MAAEIELISLIRDIGFPIAITIYLLITRDRTIQKNTDAIENLKDAIENLMLENKKN